MSIYCSIPCKEKHLQDSPTYSGRDSSWAMLTKYFHTTWSRIASLISLVLSSWVSALMVSMYVVLFLPRFGWPCWGSQGSTFEVVPSLWWAQWPAYLNLRTWIIIVLLILGRLPYSSWLFIFCCQCTFRAVHTIHWYFSSFLVRVHVSLP